MQSPGCRSRSRRFQTDNGAEFQPAFHWHIQDLVVVRKDGPELLSDKFSIEELFTIA